MNNQSRRKRSDKEASGPLGEKRVDKQAFQHVDEQIEAQTEEQ